MMFFIKTDSRNYLKEHEFMIIPPTKEANTWYYSLIFPQWSLAREKKNPLFLIMSKTMQ